MYISASAVSHIGNRDKNEDNYCFFRQVAEAEQDNGRIRKRTRLLRKPAFLGVFDGMGGISAGEKASRIAASTAGELMRKCEVSEEVLRNICDTANKRICDQMVKLQKRMGSTASMLCFTNETYSLCNLGDSPVFLLRNGRLRRISYEHTDRAEYEKLHGASDPHKKFRLTQYLGIFPTEAEISPYVVTDKVKKGDRFLICSDGMSDVLDPEQIFFVLGQNMPMKYIAEQLLNQAMENGSNDNITVICAEITEKRRFSLKWLFR